MTRLWFGVGRWFPPNYVAIVHDGRSQHFRYGFTRTTALLRGMWCAHRHHGIVYTVGPY